MPVAAPTDDRRRVRATLGRHRPSDGLELVILLAFALLSLWVLALDLGEVVRHGLSWTGTDGIFVTDQMTYLAWVRDAARHGLVSNLFELRGNPADFFEPLILLSGAIAALGVTPWLALMIWKPVAIAGLLLSTRSLVHRTVPGRCGRRVAIGLALFFVGPGAFVADKLFSADSASSLRWSAITFDLSLGFWSWGYSFGLISLAAAVFGLIMYERARETGRRRWLPPLLGALAGSLHPWQGATFILVVAGTEVLMLRRRDLARLVAPAVTVAIAAIPLLYFVVLNRVDPSWALAQSSAHSTFPLWMVAATLAPLGLPALAAYRIRPQRFLAWGVRLWPPAALIIFLLSETKLSAAPTHALLGISIPLAVLAVEGMRSLHWGRHRSQQLVTAALILAALVPATIYELTQARDVVKPGPQQGLATGPAFLKPGERGALDYLSRDSQSGGVLSEVYLGTVVPGLTGRHTYVGNYYYSPEFAQRATTTSDLFAGRLAPGAALQFVRRTGARFVLADCRSTAPLRTVLAPVLASVRRFGCATVYALR